MQSIHSMSPRELLRKAYGHEIAERLMAWWYHWHIEDPVTRDEAIMFYVLGEE